MEKKIRTLGVLTAKSFSADLDEVDRGAGGTGLRLVVRHPSAVVVVPLLGPSEVMMVAQYRYALGRETIEFPAGKLDPGEEPEEAARRELAEETGHRAAILKRLLSFAPSIGYSTEIIHVFAARNLERLETAPDEDEIARVLPMDLSRLRELIRKGEIIDGTTMLALAVCEWWGEI